MEINTQTENQVSSINNVPSKKSGWKTSFLTLLILVIAAGGLAYYTFTQGGFNKICSSLTNSSATIDKCENAITPETPVVDTQKPEQIFTVNVLPGTQNAASGYLTYQLKYSSKYVVTSGDMLTSYVSQGGMAQPDLIFTKDTQPLLMDTQNYLNISNIKGDCIIARSTTSIDKIEDYRSTVAGDVSPIIVSSGQITLLENITAEKQIVTYEGKTESNVEVFFQLPENVSYYFQTCNMNSEKDLDMMLSNLKVRAFDLIGQ